MKLRKNIQKIGALAGSGLMATLSVASPVAADLGDLPQPFIQDGEFDGNLVVGEEAQTEDVLGAIDIASSFQAEATSPVEVGGGGSVTVEGGEDYTEAVGIDLNGGSSDTLNYQDLEGFEDSDAELEDEDYDYEEKLGLASGFTGVATSAIRNYDEEDNYGQEAYLEAESDSVNYSVQFDNGVPVSDFGSDDMDIEFAGTEMTIIDAEDGSPDSLRVETFNEYTLEAGDSVEVDDHTITLERVGESSVLVSVDGQQKAISYPDDNDATFEDADDFEVEVDSAFYEEGQEDNLAVLNLGSSLTETYEDGDALEIFGGPDDEDEATWTWDIAVNNSGNNRLNSFGVSLNQNFEETTAEDQEERAALPMDEALEFPNNRAEMTFSGYEEPEMTDYSEVDIGFSTESKTVDSDDEDIQLGSDDRSQVDDEQLRYLELSTDEQAFNIGNFEAEEVSITATADGSNVNYHVFGDDGDDEYYLGYADDFSGPTTNLELDEDTLDLGLTSTSSNGTETVQTLSLEMDESPTEEHDFEVEVDTNSSSSDVEGLTHFGDTSSDASESDYTYTFTEGSNNQAYLNGNDDEPRRTAYGVTFDDMEDMLDSDDVTLDVPHDGHEARVLFSSEDTQVSSSSSDSGAVEVNRIPVGLGVLDSDVVSNGEVTAEGPHIVVGGPYANTAASALLGNPSSSEIEQMFSPGQATIRMFDDANALLVAGYNPQDTVRASRVVADYQDYSEELTGSEVELVFDGSEDIEFQAPSMDDSSTNSSQ